MKLQLGGVSHIASALSKLDFGVGAGGLAPFRCQMAAERRKPPGANIPILSFDKALGIYKFGPLVECLKN